MSPAAAKKGLLTPRVSARMHPGIKFADILSLFQQLSTLFDAGTSMLEVLRIATSQTPSKKLHALLHTVTNRVAGGSPLHAALSEFPKTFKRQWIEVIKSGEDTGELPAVLRSLAAELDAAAELRSKIISAMTYPAILAVVATGAVSAMLIKVVPTFADLFRSSGKPLPSMTQTVLDISAFLQAKGPFILGGIVVSAFLFRRYIRTPGGRRRWHGLLVSVPLIGDMVVQSCMQKFADGLSMLLRSGLTLHEAVHSMQGVFETNVIYQRALGQIEGVIASGGTMSSGMERSGVFTSLLTNMARVGEESGTLPDVLGQIGAYYRKRVEAVVSRVMGSLETVMIVVMGSLIAFILAAIYIPMFEMASSPPT